MAELESSLTDIGWLNQKLTFAKHKKIFESYKLNDNKTTNNSSPNHNYITNHNNTQSSDNSNDNTQSTLLEINHHKKPLMSYATLILRALQDSSSGRLSVSQIYQSICLSHPYFRTVKQASWQNSVRHNLSLHRCFKRLKRPKHETGKGAYWAIDTAYLASNLTPAHRKCFSRNGFNSPVNALGSVEKGDEIEDCRRFREDGMSYGDFKSELLEGVSNEGCVDKDRGVDEDIEKFLNGFECKGIRHMKQKFSQKPFQQQKFMQQQYLQQKLPQKKFLQLEHLQQQQITQDSQQQCNLKIIKEEIRDYISQGEEHKYHYFDTLNILSPPLSSYSTYDSDTNETANSHQTNPNNNILIQYNHATLLSNQQQLNHTTQLNNQLQQHETQLNNQLKQNHTTQLNTQQQHATQLNIPSQHPSDYTNNNSNNSISENIPIHSNSFPSIFLHEASGEVRFEGNERETGVTTIENFDHLPKRCLTGKVEEFDEMLDLTDSFNIIFNLNGSHGWKDEINGWKSDECVWKNEEEKWRNEKDEGDEFDWESIIEM